MPVSIDASKEWLLAASSSVNQADLVALVSSDRFTRRDAAQRLGVRTEAARQALRRALFHDPYAAVRQAAAERLGRCPNAAIAEVALWLSDATSDAAPLVREAALRSLGRLSVGLQEDAPTRLPEACSLCMRLVREEPVWWVRRAAVLALSAIAGELSIPALRRVLGDPFWRVRHAATQALLLLGEAQPRLRTEILLADSDLPPLAQSGLLYLRARWQPGVEIHAFPPLPTDGELKNSDPAVVTARLRALSPKDINPLELVQYLCDPHEPLRKLAVARLRARPFLPALRMALKWLETPTQPHATEAVLALLERVPEPARVLCKELLSTPAHDKQRGALRWAASYAAATGDAELRPALLNQVRARHPHTPTRAALLTALALLEPLPIAELTAALDDPQREVRSAAAMALAAHEPQKECAQDALWARSLDGYAPLARCALVESARRRGDLLRLEQVAKAEKPADSHPLSRAQALEALAQLGELERIPNFHKLLEESDPAIRAGVLRCAAPAVWLKLLAHDPDPLVRRRALSLIVGKRKHLDQELRSQAAALASRALDPWLRIFSCELIDFENEKDRPILISLLCDSDLGVRAAAADRLQALEKSADQGLSFRVNALLSNSQTWIEDEQEEPASVRRISRPRILLPPRRVLGRTGIAVSPLGISGAYDPPDTALRAALRAGVNLFFWEPRYLGLTRFLRHRINGGGDSAQGRRQELVIVAGSFEGDRVGIERDVARTLRRLGTDYIDVFLLFWVRSEERLSQEVRECLLELKQKGRIRSVGFSTHHRDLAARAISAENSPWDVLMLRHSAAHPGAEETLLPLCEARGVGVIAFSELCYGRLLRPIVFPDGKSNPGHSAGECYRYGLSQPGVAVCLSAPRSARELRENLEVLPALSNPLEPEVVAKLREHGRLVRQEDRRFDALLRKGHEGAPEALAGLNMLELLEHGAPENDPAVDAEGGDWLENGAASRLSWRGRSEKM